VLLPVCLRHSGLSATAATAQFGLMTGMAMPLMLIPGVVTSALCMITTPAISRAEGDSRALRCTMQRLLRPALLIGLLASAGLFFTADFLSFHLYHTPALAPLVRFMCPLALLFALHQVQMGMITGLGLQRRSLTATIVSSLASLLCAALLVPLPQVRLFGAALASMLGQVISVLWNAAILRRAKQE
ncbi:MAG: polysaccharide biosynthesis C-terminal domain-containing protein, partial [Clostridia bacterium]|nr:polysaccharide biosynthesis C-terminal domain-containing protein [Clostridia bacterium]